MINPAASAWACNLSCPPSTVFGAYHHYRGPRRIEVYPFSGHEEARRSRIRFDCGFWPRCWHEPPGRTERKAAIANTHWSGGPFGRGLDAGAARTEMN
ncbi:acetylxylan esterase [Micromonospora sp. MH33]|uniref:acetylxylan esterase n=1 Tax=Micromonospora sp. MH33 TaxID=1945509 RepID=UPI001FEEAFD4|nr:acetylxylan esterase [Micromonospora sp. MH33]